MLIRGWALTTLTLGVLLATAPWANAQAPGDRAGTEKETIRVYRLTEADCKSVGGVLAELPIPLSVSVDPSTQSLVVYADHDGHQQVEQLLAQLDAPIRDRDERTEFLPLSFRDAEEAAILVSQVVSRRRSRVAFDAASQSIIVTGTDSTIEAARKIVSRIDKPRRALTLSFFFVQGVVGDGSDDSADELPEDLRGIARSLAKSGFMDLTLLAPMTTAVQEDSEFSTSGYLGDPTRLQFEIEGDVHESAMAESARVTLAAAVKYVGGEGSKLVFSVETSLTTNLGDYVVLAAAPAQNGENQAMALIVRVD